MDIPQLTGRQVKYIRSMLDLTQAELAQKAGVSQPTIYRMELDAAKAHESIAVVKISALADENHIMVPDQSSFATKTAPAELPLETKSAQPKAKCHDTQLVTLFLARHADQPSARLP